MPRSSAWAGVRFSIQGSKKSLVEVLLMQRPEGRGDPSWQHRVPFPDIFTAPCWCGWRCSFPLLLGPLNPYLTSWYTALLVGRSSALTVSVRAFPSHAGRWMDGDHQGATLAPAASLAFGGPSSACHVPSPAFALNSTKASCPLQDTWCLANLHCPWLPRAMLPFPLPPPRMAASLGSPSFGGFHMILFPGETSHPLGPY